jgi:hypothetical protein
MCSLADHARTFPFVYASFYYKGKAKGWDIDRIQAAWQFLVKRGSVPADGQSFKHSYDFTKVG